MKKEENKLLMVMEFIDGKKLKKDKRDKKKGQETNGRMKRGGKEGARGERKLKRHIKGEEENGNR